MARSITHPSTDRQNRMIFIGATGLAALAAILVFASLSGFGSGGGGGSSGALTADTNVVVASRDISPGEKISGDMVEIATLPKNAIIAGAITDKNGLDGLTARYPLAKGDQLSAVKLGQTDKGKTFTGVIPTGRRAVAVDVEEKTSVGGLIVAGDHVDVIVIGKAVTKTNGQELPASFTLLQDIEVLSVAQNAQEPVARLDKDGNPINTDTADGSIAAAPSDTSAKPKAKTVTLSVTPEEAARLALAAQSYSVYLSARAPGDDGRIDNPDELQQLPDVQ